MQSKLGQTIKNHDRFARRRVIRKDRSVSGDRLRRPTAPERGVQRVKNRKRSIVHAGPRGFAALSSDVVRHNGDDVIVSDGWISELVFETLFLLFSRVCVLQTLCNKETEFYDDYVRYR